MTWIRTISVAEAAGRLKESYEAALARAGRVFGIVRAMSPAPDVLDASMALYRRVMFASPGLTRARRELIAVVVSARNACHY